MTDASDLNTWQLKIINIAQGNRFHIYINEISTIRQIKEVIYAAQNISVNEQHLTFRNKPLFKDNLTLQDYGAAYNKDCELHLFYISCDQRPDIPQSLKRLHPKEVYAKFVRCSLFGLNEQERDVCYFIFVCFSYL